MKTKTMKRIGYILLIAAVALLLSHLEHKQVQEDIQAQADCRVQDIENY